jgi:hypothetical protein
MAPLSADPCQIQVALNAARRKAFYDLVKEITVYMRSQLEVRPPSPTESSPPPLPSRSPTTSGGDKPRTRDAGNGGQTTRKQAPPSPALVNLRKAALRHFDSWQHEVLGKLREIASAPDDQKILDARRERAKLVAEQKAKEAQKPHDGEDLISFGGGGDGATAGSSSSSAAPATTDPAKQVSKKTVASIQSHYHPIPTRLTTIPLEDRQEALTSMLLLLLSMGNYSAYSRTLICYLASALEVSPQFVDHEEVEIAITMMETVQKAQEEQRKNGGMSADAEAQKRAEAGKFSRYWKVGLASVAGAAIIGVTGGLAAPLVAGTIGGIMGSVGLGSLASFLGIFWMNGALVGTLFGAFGAKMTGEMIDQYAREVEDFRFVPLKNEWGVHSAKGDRKDGAAEVRRLRVTIGINGWLREESDVTRYWRPLGDESEVFALRYELKTLLALGTSLQELVTSYAWKAIKIEILKRTVLATLWGALWPIQLVMMASRLDNPFSLARNRSEKAGKILADALINKVQGERPVTLVGYSLGARVIYYCLRELAAQKAFGLVDTVVLIGAPVPSNAGHWQMMKTVVTGKLFNVYSEQDFILAFLYRATSAQLGIAGLQAINEDIEGVENLNLSEEVLGHLRYPDLIPQVLSRCGFNNVIGGDGAIEKEADAIQLTNDDYPDSGNLIDFGEPQKKQLEPTRYDFDGMANEKFDPSVKNKLEQKTDVSVRDAKVMGERAIQDHKLKTPSPLPEADDPLTLRSPGSGMSPAPQMGSRQDDHDAPPPYYPETDDMKDDDHDIEDDDEGKWGGIQMQNNDDDGDMATVEPLSIEDHEERSSTPATGSTSKAIAYKVLGETGRTC